MNMHTHTHPDPTTDIERSGANMERLGTLLQDCVGNRNEGNELPEGCRGG